MCCVWLWLVTWVFLLCSWLKWLIKQRKTIVDREKINRSIISLSLHKTTNLFCSSQATTLQISLSLCFTFIFDGLDHWRHCHVVPELAPDSISFQYLQQHQIQWWQEIPHPSPLTPRPLGSPGSSPLRCAKGPHSDRVGWIARVLQFGEEGIVWGWAHSCSSNLWSFYHSVLCVVAIPNSLFLEDSTYNKMNVSFFFWKKNYNLLFMVNNYLLLSEFWKLMSSSTCCMWNVCLNGCP